MPLTEKHLAVAAPGLCSPDPAVRRIAFAELVKAHHGRELAYLRSDNPALHEHVLEEIVEDTFNHFWREVESGDPVWMEKWTWAYFQVANKKRGIDAFRKLSRAKFRFGKHQSEVPESHEKEVAVYGSDLPNLDANERRREHLQIIKKTIAELPEQQRRIAVILQQNPESRLSRLELMELYRKAHGVAISDAAVKGALAVVRKKLNQARGHAASKE